jgi:cytochrome c553
MSRETYLSLIHSSSGNGNNGVDATGAIAPAAVATSNRQGRPTIAPFIPSRREIPYLPGNPQDPYASAASVVSPRIGFGTLDATAADPMAACTNCHGSDLAGRHGGSFPNLTLQTPQYIYDSLKAFASGERQSGIMWPVAATLSDEQMRALASRIGGGGVTVSPADLKGAAAGSTERRRGEDVAASGLDKNGQPPVGAAGGSSEAPAVKVERCTSCHLPAADLDRIVPRIDGQNAAYLRQQLIAFRGGGRGDTSPYDPMTADSHNLSDADIRAVADYYASRPPIAKN